VVELRVEVEGQTRRFLARCEDEPWRVVGRVDDASFLSDEGVLRGKHHTGTLVGVYANAGGSSSWVPADFDWFHYVPTPGQKSPKGGHQNPHVAGYSETIMKASPTSTLLTPWLALATSMVKRHAKGTEKWHYEHGLLLGALEQVGVRTGQVAYQEFVQAYMEALVAPDGRIVTYRDDEFNLDQVNPGKVAMVLAARSTDPRWKACLPRLRDQLVHQPRTASGGFWHKKIYPDQMWLDGLYMQGPFLARWGKEYGSSADFEEVVAQLVLIESKARDRATGLLYHAWDESRRQLWANPETGCSPHFWGRALGWYAMALVDVLEWLPASHPGVATLRAILGRLADALARFQDGSGLWFQVMDQGSRPGNYLETSASSMFAYALYKGLRLGWLSDPGTRAMADNAWAGLVNLCLKQDDAGEWNLEGICSVAGLGGTPYRDGSFQYYVSEPVVANDFKGVGPFLLAGLERDLVS
jgi:unsaturated rhamnogalacturonyl hydrolase